MRVLCKSISQSTSVMWKGNQYFLQFSVSFALCVCPPTPQKFKKHLCSQSCHLFLHNSWDLCHVLERYSLLHDYKSKHSLIVSSIIFMVWVFIFTLWIHLEFILWNELGAQLDVFQNDPSIALKRHILSHMWNATFFHRTPNFFICLHLAVSSIPSIYLSISFWAPFNSFLILATFGTLILFSEPLLSLRLY